MKFKVGAVYAVEGYYDRYIVAQQFQDQDRFEFIVPNWFIYIKPNSTSRHISRNLKGIAGSISMSSVRRIA